MTEDLEIVALDVFDELRHGSLLGFDAAYLEEQPAPSERESGSSTPPVNEREVRNVTIETVGDQGDGIAKVERGYVVIIPGVHPGDEPIVEIEQVTQNIAFASVVDNDTINHSN